MTAALIGFALVLILVLIVLVPVIVLYLPQQMGALGH